MDRARCGGEGRPQTYKAGLTGPRVQEKHRVTKKAVDPGNCCSGFVDGKHLLVGVDSISLFQQTVRSGCRRKLLRSQSGVWCDTPNRLRISSAVHGDRISRSAD